MVLDTSTKSLIVTLAGAVTTTQLDWSASWVNRSSVSDEYENAHGQTNSTTEVTLVSAPSTSSRKQITSVVVHNRDTVAATVIFWEADGATRRRIGKRTVAVDSSVTFDGAKFHDFPEPSSSIGAVDISVTGDIAVGDDLAVTDDATVGGDLAVTGTSTFTGLLTAANVTMTGTWTYNAFSAKGELIGCTADNTPGILAAASGDYHVLSSRSSTATGLAWAHRGHLWHREIADAAAHHTSATESAALYSSTAIPSAYINEAGTTIRVCVEGLGSTTGAPSLICSIKFNDGFSSQVIAAPTTGSIGSGVTNVMCTWEGQYTVRTTGATGTIQGWQKGHCGATTTPSSRAEGVITLDLTNPITVEVTLTWSVSSASNTATLRHFTVEILKA